MPKSPLPELSRKLLLPHYIGDVRAWKADNAAETVVFGVKDPARDADDLSFYAMARDGTLSYLGTTALGKDGGVSPIVYNDGVVVLLLSEVPDPAPNVPGAMADLYLVTLQYRVGAEPVSVDAVARASASAAAVVAKQALDAVTAVRGKLHEV